MSRYACDYLLGQRIRRQVRPHGQAPEGGNRVMLEFLFEDEGVVDAKYEEMVDDSDGNVVLLLTAG